MKNLEELSLKIADEFKSRGIVKAQHCLSSKETLEFTLELGEFKLLRTLFDNGLSVTVYDGARKGVAAGNDLSWDGINSVIDSAVSSARASDEDPAYDFAPDQGEHIYNDGAPDVDKDKFFERISEFSKTLSEEYPQLRVSEFIAKHQSFHIIQRNTNGSHFDKTSGYYEIVAQYCATGEDITTNIDYVALATVDLDTPFIDQSTIRKELDDSVLQLKRVEIPGKFTGSVILKPDCMQSFLGSIIGNYASSNSVLEGTSQWLDKVGEKVADERLTVTFDPEASGLINPAHITGDDFVAEKYSLIENGVFNGHMLNLYASNKSGRPLVKNDGNNTVITAGDKSLSDIIRETKQGLIVKSFAGGQPGSNGEFSGIVKNSLYVENGEIKGAVTETMINGNLGGMLNNIRDISSEVVYDGFSAVPYIAFENIVVSTK